MGVGEYPFYNLAQNEMYEQQIHPIQVSTNTDRWLGFHIAPHDH